MKVFNILSVLTNILLILVLLLRSPDEQSLQENITPFPFFESSSKAENILDKLIKTLIAFYFIFGLLFAVQNSL
uniref:Protein-export membrane protein SecG n=1 Tax=Ishige okamurae TaxID=233772 RepID=A0A8E5XRE1_9PHAE|nr:hypothetical protein Ycf47 [Ishige okamurae]QVJ99597.1 hypothetical protein Ycf47 [Ishige okamurae]